jgi:hypothetical protein
MVQFQAWMAAAGVVPAIVFAKAAGGNKIPPTDQKETSK